MKKKALTLLEVMIALVLAGLLLAFLFGAWGGLSRMTHQVERIKQKILSRQIIQQRLSSMVSVMDACYTDEEKALFIKYDESVDRDDRFTGSLLCRLSLLKGELRLALTGKEGAAREEVLAEHVKSVSWSFFDFSKLEWVALWDEDAEELPVMIRLSIQEEGLAEPVEFAFFLPDSLYPIVYLRPVGS
jgi:prepilin-type N-terminal cleavage/methylation domain-containing protein